MNNMSIGHPSLPPAAGMVTPASIVASDHNSVLAALSAITISGSSSKSASRTLRCSSSGCGKKIPKIDNIAAYCLCKKPYCMSHRSFVDHACTFDHKSKHRAILQQKLVGEEIKEGRRDMSGDRHDNAAY